MAMQTSESIKLRELDACHKQRKKQGYRWLVESRIGGKRQRKFFPHGKKAEAEAYKTELEGRLGKVSESHRKLISEALLTEAASAQEILTPYNETITKAVAFYVEYLEKQANRDMTPIDDVAEIAARIMEGKGGTKGHMKKTRAIWSKASDYFDNAPLTSVSGDQLEEWIESFGFKSSTTCANYRTALHTLYSAAVSKGIVEKNLAADLPDYKRKSCNEVLSPGEVASILAECDDEILPAITICFFCGIRPDYLAGEISRLDWKDIKLAKRRIRLGSSGTKTKEFRSVTIPENLAAWLEPFAKPSGPVVGNKGRFRRLWVEAREQGLERAWPHDATRNSFASYHMELCGNEFETATQTGHSDIKTLRDHYKDLVDHDDAVAYFEIRPASESDVIPITKAV
jgi:integrase